MKAEALPLRRRRRRAAAQARAGPRWPLRKKAAAELAELRAKSDERLRRTRGSLPRIRKTGKRR